MENQFKSPPPEKTFTEEVIDAAKAFGIALLFAGAIICAFFVAAS